MKRFIHVSTDEVYGESTLEKDDKSFAEHSAFNPSNPYAASKCGAEFMVKVSEARFGARGGGRVATVATHTRTRTRTRAQSYRTSFGLPTIITRGNNVYGPRQYPEKLIPKFISLLERKQKLPIHGDGRHLRSFLYVSRRARARARARPRRGAHGRAQVGDVARAFALIVRKGVVGEVYNVGTDFEIANIEVARALLREYKLSEAEYVTFVPDRNFNDVRYHIDRSRLLTLGWKPEVAFADGLRETIAWYRANPDHFGDVSHALVAHPRLAGPRPDVFFK